MDNADEENTVPFVKLAALTANVTRFLLERREQEKKYRERKTSRQRTDEDHGEDKRHKVDDALKEKPAT